MKKIYIFIFFILGSVLLNSFLYSPNILDVSTGENLNNIFLQWPVLRLFIEPFYAFAYYILTMERSGYIFALISWVCWALLFVIVFSICNREKVKNIIIYSFFSLFFLISIICAIVVLPVPGPKLQVPEGYKAVDIHSHTISSRDNISSVLSSISFHKKHGYTDFFITEHDNTSGFYSIPADINSENIFPGIQIRTSEGVSILLLSKYQFKYGEFRGKNIKEMTKLAHAKGMLVIMPHWWKWHRPPLQDLVDMGIDGFEIYNCGYRYISTQTRQQIIDICEKNNLMMFGTTDWHGLGFMTNVWTLIEKDNDKDIFALMKEKRETQIITHDTKGSQSVVRYIFEPFYAFYNYIAYTQLQYILSFFMIVSLIIALFIKFSVIRIMRFVSLGFSLFYSVTLFYFSYILSYNMYSNVIIPETIFPMAISLVFIWLVIWGFCDKNI